MLSVLPVTAASSGVIGDFGMWGDIPLFQLFPCHPQGTSFLITSTTCVCLCGQCLLGQQGHLHNTPTRLLKSKLVVNGLACTVRRLYFFSIKTFYSFRGFEFNMIGSSVTLQLINVCHCSLLYWRNILCLFYISRHMVCLNSPALTFQSLFYIHCVFTFPLLLCITGMLAIKYIFLDSSISKTPQVFSQNPFYFLSSEVY